MWGAVETAGVEDGYRWIVGGRVGPVDSVQITATFILLFLEPLLRSRFCEGVRDMLNHVTHIL